MLVLFKGIIIGFIIIMLLIFIDLLFCVGIKLKFGKFDWNKFLDYLKTGLTPYVLIWSALSLVGVGIPFVAQWIGADIGLETIIPVSGIVAFVWGTIVSKCINSIREKAKELEIEIKALK